MLTVIDSKAGGQACLLAPTEILALQHYTSFSKLAKGLRKKARESAYNLSYLLLVVPLSCHCAAVVYYLGR